MEGREVIKAFVPGACVPWSVSRHRGGKEVALTSFQQKIQAFVSSACKSMETCAMRLQFDFVIPRPKRPKYWYPKRKDLTNLQKAAEDALTGLCFTDDSQVVEIASRKRYPVGDEADGVHIQISVVRQPQRRAKRT